MTGSGQYVAIPSDIHLTDFDYELPKRFIAQTPLDRREDSRMLVLEKTTGAITHSRFRDLAEWLSPGDLLVANNSRVMPARLRGIRQPTGGAVEVLLLNKTDGIWSALAKPAKRLQAGDLIEFRPHAPSDPIARANVVRVLGRGEIQLRFEDSADDELEAIGEAPLPPYITARLEDASRYQTVYGHRLGSSAAPTAGLHFTCHLIEELKSFSVDWAEVTLHIGQDTFRPVSAERIEDHVIHREWCEIPDETVKAIAECRQRGNRVIAVGTTAARTLETLGRIWNDADPLGFVGTTDIFIVPGHQWRLVDGLITNFHLPRSTLLMMVSALAGREAIMGAYTEAMESGYRFYSFGDAMLIQ